MARIELPPAELAAAIVLQRQGTIVIGGIQTVVRQLLLFVPRFDARLDSLEFSEGSLKVKSSFVANGLQIAVLATDGAKTTRLTKPLEAEHQFALMANPTTLRVFVVNDRSEILDSFAEDENWSTRHRVIFAGTAYPTELMAMIRGGETDKVEFK